VSDGEPWESSDWDAGGRRPDGGPDRDELLSLARHLAEQRERQRDEDLAEIEELKRSLRERAAEVGRRELEIERRRRELDELAAKARNGRRSLRSRRPAPSVDDDELNREREQAAADRETAIRAHELRIEEEAARLADRERKLADAEAAAAKRDQELAAADLRRQEHEASLARATDELVRRTATVEASEQEIEAERARLEARAAELEERARAIQSDERQTTDLGELQLAARLQALDERTQALDRRERELGERESVGRERNQRRDEESNRRTDELEARIAAREAELEGCRSRDLSGSGLRAGGRAARPVPSGARSRVRTRRLEPGIRPAVGEAARRHSALLLRRRRALSARRAPELAIQQRELDERAQDHPGPRARLPPVAPRVVAHGHLPDAEAEALGPHQDLRVHEGADRRDRDRLEHAAVEHLEGAVDVAHGEAEEEPHAAPPAEGQRAPHEGVAPGRAVAGHDVAVGGEGEERLELGEVELEVGVAEEDEVAARGAETRAERRPVAPVRRVGDDAQTRVLAPARVEERRAPVAAPVVDEDQLEGAGELRRDGEGGVEERPEVRLLVADREHEGERGPLGAHSR
jgi:hypothetical protein